MGLVSRQFVGFFLALVCIVCIVPSFAECAGKENAVDNEKRQVIVGFLQTEKETYAEELTFSHNIPELLVGLGARVVRIDYNTILDFDEVMMEAVEEVDGDIENVHKVESRIIKDKVLSFLREKGITRVFIPGNYYNIDTEPYAPTPNRQLITAALAEIVAENQDIKILGICGGMQGIMHALGVKVVRVHKIVGTPQSTVSHFISMPDPHEADVVLHRVKIVPGSRLASIVSKHVKPDANQWYSLFFPDAHGGVVSNDPENMNKLEQLGYKVVGFSEDGIIEAVEDKHGNMLFQDHPEALAINFMKGSLYPGKEDNAKPDGKPSKETLRYKAALSAVAIIENFLYGD